MRDTAIRKLAEYLTAGRVAKHSIGLSVGAVARTEALDFFDLRGALGVSGYATADEAEAAIRQTLNAES